MSIFKGILLIVCILFTVYKMVMAAIRSCFLAKKRKKVSTVIIKEPSYDKRFYSSPSFDFPNVQSEADMRIVNSGPDLCKKQNKISVKEYCKY